MTGMGDMSAEASEAYRWCAGVVRARARNFYYGLRLTPEPRRSAIYSIYAWMRRADDETDSAGDVEEKKKRLEEFARETERVISGAPASPSAATPGAVAGPPGLAAKPARPGHPIPAGLVWTALGETIRRFKIDPAHLRSMIAGLETDLEHEAAGGAEPVMLCATRAELERYCYRVASTVGLVCVSIWGLKPGVDRAEADRLAVKRGLAFQLTNILRDYAEDFDEGRVYLPAEDFAAGRVSAEDVRRWAKPAACEAMVCGVAAWARREYDESRALERMIDPACYATLRTMTRIYSGLLHVIEREPSRIAGRRRIRLQSLHKAGIAVRACARAWVNQHVPAGSPLYAVLTPGGPR